MATIANSGSQVPKGLGKVAGVVAMFFTRTLKFFLTFLGITILAFILVRSLPGDPIEIMMGERGISAERHAELAAELGLDKPLIIQYFHYLSEVLSGNLGNSLTTSRPVIEDFLARFPATLELGLAALIISVPLGIAMGIISVHFRDSFFDKLVRGVSLAGYSMPLFWWAILMIMFLSVMLKITPVSGRIDVIYFVPKVTGLLSIDTLLAGDLEAFRSAISHLVLPSIVIGTIPTAVIAKMTRSSMLEVLNSDFMRTAKAKGAGPLRILLRHGLPNAMIPVLTIIGLQVGGLVSGAILTETIFAWPGVGSWLIDAVNKRDYPVVQGGVLLIATMVTLINLAVDALTTLMDPRWGDEK